MIRVVFSKVVPGVLVAVCATGIAHAQIDPAAGMLLNSSQSQSGRDGGLDSGRYTVKKKSPVKKQPSQEATATANASSNAVNSSSGSSASTATATVSQPTPAPSITPVATSTPAPEQTQGAATAEATVVVQASPAVVQQPVAPALEEANKDLGPSKFDRRASLLELSLSPVFIYNDSDSSYWYRSYHTSSPGAHLDATVWLSPTFGLHTSFMTSLSGSVSDSVDRSRVVEAGHTWFDLGMRFRHFANHKVKSPALVLGVDFSEYHFKAPTSAMNRHRVTTTGVQLKAGVELPRSKRYMSTADVNLIPKAQHQELETRSIVKSGNQNETNTFGASLGGVYRIDRSNAYFWRVSHRVEKNVFSGNANAVDPVTGITPSGVSVTNSFTLFEVGCTWGD